MKRLVFAAKAVFFDWDGTLLNSFAADERAYLSMFEALGINFTAEDLARNYHPDWYHVYRAARIHRSRWQEADRLWREAYAHENTKLLPGARTVLRNLAKRFTLGLVTSGSRDRVCIQLENLHVANHFAVRVCSEDASSRKPHPAPLKRALALAGLAPEDCVYVGDSPQDIEMARRAKVRSIGIFGPFPTEAGLRTARPTLLLKSITELPHRLAESAEPTYCQQVTESRKKPGQKKRRARRRVGA
ncbi:MAG: HAD family hydrolase [Candidatus Acidiferrales bacterium]